MGPHLLYMVFQYLFLDLYADIRTCSRSQFLGCIGWCFASLTGVKDVAIAKDLFFVWLKPLVLRIPFLRHFFT